jgi:hypothetical protein
MGLASLGLDIGIFCDFLYSVNLLSAVLGLDFLGPALSWPQVLLGVATALNLIVTFPYLEGICELSPRKGRLL